MGINVQLYISTNAYIKIEYKYMFNIFVVSDDKRLFSNNDVK